MNLKINTQLALVFALVLSGTPLPAMEQSQEHHFTAAAAIPIALAIVYSFLQSVRCPLDWDDDFYYELDTIALISDSNHGYYIHINRLNSLLHLAPGLASIITSYSGQDKSYIKIHSVHSLTLFVLQQLALGQWDEISARLSQLTHTDLKRLECDARYLGATKVLDLIQRCRSA